MHSQASDTWRCSKLGLSALEGSLLLLFVASVNQHILFPLFPQCNKMPKGRGSLPPQHGLELLTVYAWEQGGRDPQFNMAQGFRTVLELVSQYHQLCVYWTVNYNDKDKTVRDFLNRQLRQPRFWSSLPITGSQRWGSSFSHIQRAQSRDSKILFLRLSSFLTGIPLAPGRQAVRFLVPRK